jgi:Zn finger protein HypA/HybF involved in hydrogenase expression
MVLSLQTGCGKIVDDPTVIFLEREVKMQVRCFNCQMPIAMSRDAIYAALDVVTDENLTHYDVRCPKCRKTNRVSRKQLLRAAPNWTRDREEPPPKEG